MKTKPASDIFPTTFRPYIPAAAKLREMTPIALIFGTLLGIVFGASSLYLVLKVGLTVSASIPVAVISITFFRLLSKLGGRDATILEHNIVQTAGSAGESIAFGIGVTMPAIMILGFDLEAARVLLVAILGGLLGIFMMIPLRRALIVQQHGVLAYLVLIPAIKFFGSGLATPVPPGTVPISEMTPDAIRGAYVLYIGSGAVAAGGIVSLLRSMPTIWTSLLEGLRDFRAGAAA